jgi:hypothetical protein
MTVDEKAQLKVPWFVSLTNYFRGDQIKEHEIG